ncbi:uncharacterized protein MONOS_15310 [Monocercomonoides exilis]|uniref:uncharacterized protein n=1 Tax=Monocercomonoides exilis TaxID=2049356 RepID=UPI00355A9F23|nr:hypothetical protein MONOS_15310 [Monocercomonoides exilis]|eukprot:MONOS_15310.1-p1 / transcript=MONOS_15310.1 / gene=MONOS_15310 / organism=Monocercomonoides_exilis_PA203 / gene_product=unspecified product / transcript_product=unspecified product / location=Mono_scaffold01195:5102-5502(+) / protein_length=114 / sequence_SO=supercontig / SO=protein_coding / is_pseudo=false
MAKIVEKGLSEVGLRMEDAVLSPAAIALAVLEELEEAEEGGGNERKSTILQRTEIVEALELSRLKFMNTEAEAKVDTDKQHSVEPEMCSSSLSDEIQQEISRADEEEAIGLCA